MEIKTLPTTLNRALQSRGQKNFLANLQVGQLLRAVVLRQLPEKHIVQLNLQGSFVRAHTPRRLSVGQFLNLEVIKPGQFPQLKIILTPGIENVVVRTMRELLPKQESFLNLRNKILAITQNGSNYSALPSSFRPVIQALLHGSPQFKDIIRPEGLKQAFSHSGLFFEGKNVDVLNPMENAGVPVDTKARLLLLLSLLKTTIANYEVRPESKRFQSLTESDGIMLQSVNQNSNSLVDKKQRDRGLSAFLDMAELKALRNKNESALAKITVDQLASLPRDESGKQIWQLELPFLNGQNAELAKLKIIRDDGKRTHNIQPTKWTVELQLNPPDLDTINCKLTLSGERVDAFFRSTNKNTADLIKNHLILLKQGLLSAGLQTGYLESGLGKQTNEPDSYLNERLVDENV